MEKFLHISPIINRISILQNGILPSKVVCPEHHLKYFRRDGLLTNNENKIIYFWCDCNKNEKFIKDMVYCKTWIEPRIKYIQEMDDLEQYEKGCKILKKLYNVNLYKYSKMIFDVFLIENIKEPRCNYRPLHSQEPSLDDSVLGVMNDKYAHNNKELAFSKTPEKNIKIICQAQYYFYKGKETIKILNY